MLRRREAHSGRAPGRHLEGCAPRGRTASTLATVRLTVRLVRRGALVLAAVLAAYVVIEVQAFEAGYPDAASRELVFALAQDPVLRVLQGLPASSSIAGLVLWDAGWILQLVVAVWMIATTGRLLRGDEESGRAELVLAGPVSERGVLLAQLGVMLGTGALAGSAVAVALAASGCAVVGSVQFGALVAGVAATAVAMTAVLSQVLATRGRVVGTAATLLGAALVVRMVANSAASREWLAWFTPLGWNDQLRPYGEDRPLALLVPVGVVTALAVVAVVLRRRRDLGAGLGREGRARSVSLGLSSPIAFAARTTAWTLVAWMAGLASYGVVAGGLLPSLEDFIEPGGTYEEMLEAFGMELGDLERGFVGFMGMVLGVVVCVYAAWRIGAARLEEATARLEHLLVRPVQRWRWLGGHVLLAVASVLLLATTSGAAIWAGAAAVGADLALGDAFASVYNTLPAVAVFLGVAVLLLGIVPRLTVPVGASAPLLLYVLQVVGPPLEWPDWVLSLSPFHHLGNAPLDPVSTTAAVAMVAIGLAAGIAGAIAFQRRDVIGA